MNSLEQTVFLFGREPQYEETTDCPDAAADGFADRGGA